MLVYVISLQGGQARRRRRCSRRRSTGSWAGWRLCSRCLNPWHSHSTEVSRSEAVMASVGTLHSWDLCPGGPRLGPRGSSFSRCRRVRLLPHLLCRMLPARVDTRRRIAMQLKERRQTLSFPVGTNARMWRVRQINQHWSDFLHKKIHNAVALVQVVGSRPDTLLQNFATLLPGATASDFQRIVELKVAPHRSLPVCSSIPGPSLPLLQEACPKCPILRSAAASLLSIATCAPRAMAALNPGCAIRHRGARPAVWTGAGAEEVGRRGAGRG